MARSRRACALRGIDRPEPRRIRKLGRGGGHVVDQARLPIDPDMRLLAIPPLLSCPGGHSGPAARPCASDSVFCGRGVRKQMRGIPTGAHNRHVSRHVERFALRGARRFGSITPFRGKGGFQRPWPRPTREIIPAWEPQTLPPRSIPEPSARLSRLTAATASVVTAR